LTVHLLIHFLLHLLIHFLAHLRKKACSQNTQWRMCTRLQCEESCPWRMLSLTTVARDECSGNSYSIWILNHKFLSSVSFCILNNNVSSTGWCIYQLLHP
jgi:hypothetical protein